jgi:molecular chaperone IbpA
MRSFDFAPLYRASIGFDQIADLLDRVSTHQGGQSSYPPYNIEKTEEDGYRISIAAAGFSEADLEIEVKENTLNVSAQKPKAEDKRTYLHRGISTRAFERQFHLADHVRAVGASYEDGMLHIELIREVPEALKPRRIQIQSKPPLQVEASPA